MYTIRRSLVCLKKYDTLFYKQHFIKYTSWNWPKNQTKAKQLSDAKLSLFENYSLSSFTLSSKNNGCSKKMYEKHMANDGESETENKK